MMSIEEFLDYTDAANKANVSRQILVGWVKEGLLTKHRILNKYAVKVKELDSLLELRNKDVLNWKEAWREERRNKGYE